jgi:hypothetical protein
MSFYGIDLALNRLSDNDVTTLLGRGSRPSFPGGKTGLRPGFGFTPLVFESPGGMGKNTQLFFRSMMQRVTI